MIFLHIAQLPAGWAFVPSAIQAAPRAVAFATEVDPHTGTLRAQGYKDKPAVIAAGERWLAARQGQISGNANAPAYTVVEHNTAALEP